MTCKFARAVFCGAVQKPKKSKRPKSCFETVRKNHSTPWKKLRSSSPSSRRLVVVVVVRNDSGNRRCSKRQTVETPWTRRWTRRWKRLWTRLYRPLPFSLPLPLPFSLPLSLPLPLPPLPLYCSPPFPFPAPLSSWTCHVGLLLNFGATLRRPPSLS